MKTKVLFLCLFLAALVPANADIVNMKIWGTAAKWGGEYVSPYTAKIGTGDPFWVACLDVTLTTNAGQLYEYERTSNVPSDNRYQAAAILLRKSIADYYVWNADRTAAKLQTLGIDSWAIWNLFSPDGVTTHAASNAQLRAQLSAVTTLSANTLTAVAGGASGKDYTVYSRNPHNSQNFLSVPDGGVTLMLLGGVLVGLETLRRRLRA